MFNGVCFRILTLLFLPVWCNQSGGSAFGSLGVDTAISNIVYKSVAHLSPRHYF